MTVNEYRKKHKRCRTCKHVSRKMFEEHDLCEAKGFRFDYSVSTYSLRGCFCKLYEPKEYKDG